MPRRALLTCLAVAPLAGWRRIPAPDPLPPAGARPSPRAWGDGVCPAGRYTLVVAEPVVSSGAPRVGLATVTVTAGARPVNLARVRFRAMDDAYRPVEVAWYPSGRLPAGATFTRDAGLRYSGFERSAAIALDLIGHAGTVLAVWQFCIPKGTYVPNPTEW